MRRRPATWKVIGSLVFPILQNAVGVKLAGVVHFFDVWTGSRRLTAVKQMKFNYLVRDEAGIKEKLPQ